MSLGCEKTRGQCLDLQDKTIEKVRKKRGRHSVSQECLGMGCMRDPCLLPWIQNNNQKCATLSTLYSRSPRLNETVPSEDDHTA